MHSRSEYANHYTANAFKVRNNMNIKNKCVCVLKSKTITWYGEYSITVILKAIRPYL
jgi:hypothetical protein